MLNENYAPPLQKIYKSRLCFSVRLCQLNHLRRAALVKISKIIKNWLTVAPQGCTGSQSKQRNISSPAERTAETITMEAEAAPIIIIIKVDRPAPRADRKVRTVWDLLRRQVIITLEFFSFRVSTGRDSTIRKILGTFEVLNSLLVERKTGMRRLFVADTHRNID